VHRISAILLVIACLATQGGKSSPIPTDWGSPEIRKTAREAYQLFVASKYEAALNKYSFALQLARSRHKPAVASRILTSMANCELARQQYRRALALNTEASRTGDCEQLALSNASSAALYLQLFDLEQAMAAAERAHTLRTCLAHPYNRAEIALVLGWLRSVEGRSAEARSLLLSGIEDGDRSSNDRIVALGLHRLGAQALDDADLALADSALSGAYRIRTLTQDPFLFSTRYELAKLRLAQGDLGAALTLTQSAMNSSAGTGLAPYLLLNLRGRIFQAQGNLTAATKDFREAMQAASQWRGRILPADSFRTSSDAGLQQVYDSFINAAVQLSIREHNPDLLVEAWQAAEVNRAAGLRESLLASRSWREQISPEYWDTLAQLRAVEARGLKDSSATLQSRIQSLRFHVTELEVRAGLSASNELDTTEKNLPLKTLTTVRRVLGNSRTLMSFHLGQQASYCWTINQSRFSVSVLPSAEILNRLATQFKLAVENNDSKANSIGSQLYTELLQKPSAGATGDWLLALDGRLFEIPFAALTTNTHNGVSQYLVESNTTQIVPGAWAIGNNPQVAPGEFLGVADPIYNRADPRFHVQSTAATLPLDGLFHTIRDRWFPPDPLAELPRLVGSLPEVENCARAWDGTATVVLTGSAASRDSLARALNASPPAVLHFATHFISSRQTADETMIALSLQPGSSTPLLNLLTGRDIYSLRLPGSLVVLSGCSSAAGRSLPGAGLLGLTRAFLAAGASSVVASHWPTPDDSGVLFASFYRNLRDRQSGTPSGPAKALRAAQLEMLHSSSWRAAPRYWAAFQVTVRSN
jgi:CHAT domain-containing protein